MDTHQGIFAWLDGNEQLVYGLLFLYCAVKSGALPFFVGLATSTGSLDILAVSQVGEIVENGWGSVSVLLLVVMVGVTFLAYRRL